MANCGIKKYDQLPARVGYVDVDYLRWRLYRCNNPHWIHNIPILGWFLTPPSNLKTRNQIIIKLELVKEINEKIKRHLREAKKILEVK
jgi:hypothetical protein